MRIKAKFNNTWQTPDPDRQKVGRGSIVTIIEFFSRPGSPTSMGISYPIEKVRYYDEWGQLGETFPDSLTVIE